MKKVLVTGAGGLIGANLVRRLLADGNEVHAFVLPSSKGPGWRLDGISGDIRLHEVDLTDGERTANAVAGIKPDRVFHLAAYGAYSWQTDASRINGVTLGGTVNLLEACLRSGFGSFVNTGSSSEYGWKDHAPAEDEAAEPNSHYAVAKVASTLYCRNIATTRGLRISTLRLYSVFGPWEEPVRFVPTLAVRGLEGKLPPLVDPEVARDFVYVDDAVSAYLLASEKAEPGAVFNVGFGRQVKIREAVETARTLLGIPDGPKWGSMPNREWDTRVWVADSAKIRRELGWNPAVSFRDGFRRTVEWLRGNPAILERYRRSVDSGETTE